MHEKANFCFELYKAFRTRNQKRLRKLNDQILKAAVLSFKKELFDLAVYSYVLSKVVSKPRFLAKEYDTIMNSIESSLHNIVDFAYADLEKWNRGVTILEKDIAALEKDDPRYVTTLIRKGRLKSAATMYAQGLSLSLCSELTGIEKQEILDYSGKTVMFERLREEKDIFERIKIARRMILE